MCTLSMFNLHNKMDHRQNVIIELSVYPRVYCFNYFPVQPILNILDTIYLRYSVIVREYIVLA